MLQPPMEKSPMDFHERVVFTDFGVVIYFTEFGQDVRP